MEDHSRKARGNSSRLQGYFGENYVRAVAAAAGLRASKEDPEPEGVDLIIAWVRPGTRRERKRIEVQVKSECSPSFVNGDLHYPLTATDYHSLNGVVGQDLDLRRYLIVVTVPKSRSHYGALGVDHLQLHNLAYYVDLMGMPDLRDDQGSKTVSLPAGNLLTPEALVKLTMDGDAQEAALWMSA